MKLTSALLGLTVSLPLFAGCSALDSDASGSRPHVVTGIYPYAYVAARIAGDHATITNLTTPGVEPHDLELTPRQVADISEADVVVYESGFQPSVDSAVDQSAAGATLDVTDVVPLKDTSAPTEQDDLSGDPHIWQDPTLLIPIVEAVTSDISEADPAHEDDYRSNAAGLVSDLKDLDRDFANGLADCERTTFVTSHAAFGYLASRYDLEMIPIAGLSPEVEPSPQHLAEMADYIETDGITTVFSETLGTKAYADTLARDLGVQSAVLDPVEGLADDDSDDDYLSLMRENLAALQQANGCS
ncbi:MAG: zinc ABC transporter substrate-binding protein [Propionibacteriales bacterium]|nr:zinc ABC transporter substrate-binding protein [Propionibacteriales bacterium]